MLTFSKILCTNFDIPLAPPHFGGNFSCAICSSPEHEGMVIDRLIKSTTSDIADTFWLKKYVCVHCASLFAESRLMTSNLLAMGDAGIKPMVAQSSATDERPSWRDIVRDPAIDGQLSVAVMTSNTKRRLWTRAELSAVGKSWRVLFVDGNIDRVLTIDIHQLRSVLDLVESVYRLGFSKQAIAGGLLDPSQYKAVTNIGISQVQYLDKQLSAVRNSDEMIVACFIAQKED